MSVQGYNLTPGYEFSSQKKIGCRTAAVLDISAGRKVTLKGVRWQHCVSQSLFRETLAFQLRVHYF